MDPYEVLGVDRKADAKAIRRAYQKMVKETHPDSSGRDSEAEFRLVQEAYELLSDPERRSTYDETGEWADSVLANPYSEIAPIIEMAFLDTMHGLVEAGRTDATKVNVSSIMKSKIDEKMQELSTNQVKRRELLKMFGEVQDRMSNDEGMVACMARDHTEKLKAVIDQDEKNMETLQRAKDFVGKFSYRFDKENFGFLKTYRRITSSGS